MTVSKYYSPDTVNVRMGEWRQRRGDGVLRTLGAITCIAVSIYEPVSKSAFLAHLPTRSAKSEAVLAEMLQAVHDITDDTDQLNVWAGGAYFIGPSILGEIVLADRSYVLDTLGGSLQKPADQIRTNWLERAGYIDYMIDAGNGAETVEVVSLPINP